MKDCNSSYIDGKWICASKGKDHTIVNPANEEPIATISVGNAADVDCAVSAAKRAFNSYSETSPAQRQKLLQRIIETYKAKSEEMAETISLEMGSPISLSRKAQVPAGLAHLSEAARVASKFKFEELQGSTLMRKEPIGVCGLITPWKLADEPDCMQGAGARGGLHHGAEAERVCSPLGASVRSDSG